METIESALEILLAKGELKREWLINPPPLQEQILSVRGLRYSGDTLEQQVVVLKEINGKQVEVEEWREVPGKLPVKRGGYIPIDWSNIDWNKTTAQIAIEQKVSYAYVSQMRSIHGHKQLPKAMRSGINWDNVDWAKDNYTLAAELEIAHHHVVKMRGVLQKAPSTIRTKHSRIKPEMIESADWENRTDADIAREWSVSRERVRQLRKSNHKPDCLFKHYQDIRRRDAFKWLLGNRLLIEGKHIHDVARMIPGDLAVRHKLLLMKKTGFLFDRRREWKYSTSPPWNFDLPNIWIHRVWNISATNQVAVYRCQLRKGQAKWYSGGYGRHYLKDPAFIETLKAEIVKAKSKGINVDEESIMREVNNP